MTNIFSEVEQLRENMFNAFKRGDSSFEDYYAYKLPRSLIDHVLLACGVMFKNVNAIAFWIEHRAAPLKKQHLERELDLLESNGPEHWAWLVDTLQQLKDPSLETTLEDLNYPEHD